MEETPRRVLVVAPHPHDAELWCGGTVARWTGRGASVHYVVCADGGKGTRDRRATSPEMAATRRREQEDAARILGVREVVLLGHRNGELEDTPEFRKEIVRQIRRVRPDVVVVPEPYRRNLAWHRDHRIAGLVTLDAVFPLARDHLHFAELWEQEGLEPHKTEAILFWGTEQPNTHVDISGSMAVKTRAVLSHRSQTSTCTEAELAGLVREWARNSGLGPGFQYAESFRKLTFRT